MAALALRSFMLRAMFGHDRRSCVLLTWSDCCLGETGPGQAHLKEQSWLCFVRSARTRGAVREHNGAGSRILDRQGGGTLRDRDVGSRLCGPRLAVRRGCDEDRYKAYGGW